METITRARVPLATSRYWVSMKRFKGRLERVYCPNISQRVRWFIPGPRSSDRQRMLPGVGYCRVDDEVAPSCRMQPSSRHHSGHGATEIWLVWWRKAVRVRSIANCVCLCHFVCVCLFVRPLAYLKNHIPKRHQILYACCPCPWLSPPLPTVTTVGCPSAHLSVPSIDSSYGCWRLCYWAPCGQEISTNSCGRAAGAGAQQQMRVASCWESTKKAQHRLDNYFANELE